MKLPSLRNNFHTREIAPLVEQELDAAIETRLASVSVGDGSQGPAGPQGEPGPMGPEGPPGPKGDTGDAGAAGATGQTGPAGPQGERGDPGETGPEGPQGQAGTAGADGATGPEGPEGPAGADGANGAQGPKGDPGDTGPQGPEGPQGPQGETGPEGPAGDGGGLTAAQIVDLLMPVGHVLTRWDDTDPATLYANTTWAKTAQGRAIVGQIDGDSDFGTAGATVGAKTHQLSSAEMPSHTHVQDAHSHGLTDPGHAHAQQRFPTATGGSTGFTVDTSMSGTQAAANNTASATTGVTVDNATAVNQSTGGGGAHNNIQPSQVFYVWRRTA